MKFIQFYIGLILLTSFSYVVTSGFDQYAAHKTAELTSQRETELQSISRKNLTAEQRMHVALIEKIEAQGSQIEEKDKTILKQYEYIQQQTEEIKFLRNTITRLTVEHSNRLKK